MIRRLRRPAALALALLLAAAAALQAQDSRRRDLRDSQLRLEQIRRERADLQRELDRLRSSVRDASREVSNIERQTAVSTGALREMDFQSRTLEQTVEATTSHLIQTRDRLRERQVVLNQRLRSIYKRGPLHSVRVLLSAESFGDLLNRYKYLNLIALHDRILVEEIGKLEERLANQDRDLRSDLTQLQRLRLDKLTEVGRLQQLGSERQRTLRNVKAQEKQTVGRLEQIARDEANLSRLVADLERSRREAERRGGAGPQPGANLLTTADIGSLGWPVDGRLVYRFGTEQKPGGVKLRWNGIGIAAAAGTPVKAVESGTVMIAGAVEGYGRSVVVGHGGGYYTLYHYLQTVGVRTGQKIERNQVIGTVGGERTPEGPHIEFQVRAPAGGGPPEPVDPLRWLTARAGR